MRLPSPDPAFHWTAEAWGHALRCKPLAAAAQHAFTTKQLELRPPALRPAQGHPESGRRTARSGRPETVERVGPEAHPATWMQATASVGGVVDQLIRVKQVHGAVVRVLKKGKTGPRDVGETPAGDAIASNAPGLILSVQVADCVPILLADPRTGAVAAVHAGWRGTCAGVVRAAVAAMAREFGSDPADLVAAIGPSIGPCCYTVGQNVVDAFRDAGAGDDEISRWFLSGDDGSVRLDLWAANHDQLVNAAVRDDHVHLCRLCTLTHRDIFESYRADGERAGRMAALIAVPSRR